MSNALEDYADINTFLLGKVSHYTLDTFPDEDWESYLDPRQDEMQSVIDDICQKYVKAFRTPILEQDLEYVVTPYPDIERVYVRFEQLRTGLSADWLPKARN